MKRGVRILLTSVQTTPTPHITSSTSYVPLPSSSTATFPTFSTSSTNASSSSSSSSGSFTWTPSSPAPSGAVVSFYDKTVETFATRKARALSVREAMNFFSSSGGTISEKQLILSARFLQRELPIRMAWTLRDFQSLPYIVSINPHINRVYRVYWESFLALTNQTRPIRTVEDEKAYTETLLHLLRLNQNVITELAPGIAEVRALPHSARIDFNYIDQFLTTFISDRLFRRTLASFHQAVHLAFWNKRSNRDWVGCFHTKCYPASVCQSCYQAVSQIGKLLYGRAPALSISGDVNATFTYFPLLLENVLCELFENSIRAVHQHWPADAKTLPEIKVKVCAGQETTIIISDRGGGIPAKLQDAVWGFGFSTHRPDLWNVKEYRVRFRADEETDTYLLYSGFGFGLPVARTFIRYLGGEIIVHSLYGYGTDVYIHMPDPSYAYIATELRDGEEFSS